MWVFLLVLLVLFLCTAQGSDECPRSVSMSQNGYVDAMLGQRFNLTCNFTCLTETHKVQLLKNELLLSEISLSRDCLRSKHTIVMFLFIPAVQYTDSGLYKCQSNPPYVISSVNVTVVDSGRRMEKDKHNVTGTTQLEPTSEPPKSTCSEPVSWNAPLCYLLFKMALFLVISLSAAWKKTC